MVFLRYFGLLLLLGSFVKSEIPCPFNENCRCNSIGKDDDPKATTFSAVGCTRLSNLVFTAPKNGTYTITNGFFITGAVDKIPAGTFAAFKHIGYLQLGQPGSQSAKAQWDDDAFLGTQVGSITTVYIKGLLPLPNALKRLGETGLKGLQLMGPDETEFAELSQDMFVSFKNLEVLDIWYYNISNIHAGAFNGLPSLTWLNLLRSLQRTSFDLSILSGLNNLTELILTSSSYTELTVSNVDKVPKSVSRIVTYYSNFTKFNPNLEKVITREGSRVTLEIQYSKGITCDSSIHWMAKHALCSSKPAIAIYCAKCSDEKLLRDYLEKAVPNACKDQFTASDLRHEECDYLAESGITMRRN